MAPLTWLRLFVAVAALAGTLALVQAFRLEGRAQLALGLVGAGGLIAAVTLGFALRRGFGDGRRP